MRLHADLFAGLAGDDYGRALSDADVVAAATHPSQPVVRREWVREGTHINSVGFSPGGEEVDALTLKDALVVVETRAAALAPFSSGAAELRLAIVRARVVCLRHQSKCF